MSSAGMLKDIYAKLIGVTDLGTFTGSATGSLGEQLQYIQTKLGGASKVEQYPSGGAVGFAAAAFGSSIVPGTQPGSTNGCPAIHPDGTYLAVPLNASPYMAVYPMTGTTIGTKLADPSTLPQGNATSIAFSPNGNWLAMSRNGGTNPVEIYAFDKVAGTIGARSANPSTAWTNATTELDWHPSGNWILTSLGSTSPYVSIRGFNATSGVIASAPISNPSTLPTSGGTWYQAKFSPSGKHVAMGGNISPYLEMWSFDATAGAWGAKFSNPATLPTGQSSGVVLLDDFVVTQNQNAATSALEGYPYTASAFGTKVTNSAAGTYSSVIGRPALNQLKTHIFTSNTSGAATSLDAFPFTAAGFGTKASLANALSATSSNYVGYPAGVGSAGELIPMTGDAAAHIGNYPFIFGALWTPTISVTSLDFTATGAAVRAMIQNPAGVWSNSFNFEIGSHPVNVAVQRVLFGSSAASAKGQATGYGT